MVLKEAEIEREKKKKNTPGVTTAWNKGEALKYKYSMSCLRHKVYTENESQDRRSWKKIDNS